MNRILRLLLVFAVLTPCTVARGAGKTIDLAGSWRLRLDAADVGQAEGWFALPLTGDGTIRLPGTTDLARQGFPLDPESMTYSVPFPYSRFPGVADPGRANARGFLVRPWLYLGPAWYEREFTVPETWMDRAVTLNLERVLWQTDAWIDGRHVGTQSSLAIPHQHQLGVLPPGRHRLTLRVDNRMLLNISTIPHAYGPETQSRWNGVAGRIELSAAEPVSLERVDVYPAADRRSLRVRCVLANSTAHDLARRLQLKLLPEKGRRAIASTNLVVNAAQGRTSLEGVLAWTAPADAWDEFNPIRYRLVAELRGEEAASVATETKFGFRHIERRGRQLLVNGRPVFLRGTLDCAVYPKTGHPPMTLIDWQEVFETVKRYGFNHVRFHTWCPPEAAFEAADRLGLYLAPETAAWVDDWTRDTFSHPPAIGRDEAINQFIREEIRRISETYGNHPSFALFCIGNEFGFEGTDWPLVDSWVTEARAHDPRRVYTGTTARRNLPGDEFWVTHAVGDQAARGIGPAHTDWDLASAVTASPVPLISHETGQRPVFPDYADLLPKFTGPLKPLNLVRLRTSLEASGLAEQTKAFERASANFQLLEYKAEHEGMRRTPGLAGYQLLMLNDFTGQSEALVGILDPFWQSKGVVTAAQVREWNAPTVPLARFTRFTWSTSEEFQAQLEVAHEGPSDLTGIAVRWEVTTEAGRKIGTGYLPPVDLRAGSLTSVGSIRVPLASLKVATALTLRVRASDASNHWRFWAYPPEQPEVPPEVVVATRFDQAACALAEGRRVLLLAHGTWNQEAQRTGFQSVYWSAAWWGNGFSTLGLLCNPRHPALAGFPNEGHSDWQWRELAEGATTFRLTGAPAGYRPIIQPVPDFHYHQLLGQVFETRVGPGRLLVCGYDLTRDLDRRHAARQLRTSLLRYVASPGFDPKAELTVSFLAELLVSPGLAKRGARVVEVDSEDLANGNGAANVLDGDPATFWHTKWTPKDDPMPHTLVIDLGEEKRLAGLRFLPRQNQDRGRIRLAQVHWATATGDWSTPGTRVEWPNDAQWQAVRFPQPIVARKLKLVVEAEVNGNPFAALAEIEVLPAKP